MGELSIFVGYANYAMPITEFSAIVKNELDEYLITNTSAVSLKSGEYHVLVSANGFLQQEFDVVRINNGQKTILSTMLFPQYDNFSEDVSYE